MDGYKEMTSAVGIKAGDKLSIRIKEDNISFASTVFAVLYQKITFINGDSIEVSEEHPIWVKFLD